MGNNPLTVGDTRNTLEKSCTTKTTATTVANFNKNNFNNNLEKNIMHNPILKSASAMTPVSEITRTRKSMMATTTVAIPNSNNTVNFVANSGNKNLINHASDSINRVVSTNKSTEYKAVANSVINRTGRLKKLSAPLYMFALAIIVTIATAFSTTEVNAQPYTVDRVDYVNIEPSLIPAQETLLLPIIWGSILYNQIVNKKINGPCAYWLPPPSPKNEEEGCDTENPANWTGWRTGVYRFKDLTYGCEVRIEYLWRASLCDHNLTQHNIIGVMYEACPRWMSDWMCRLLYRERWWCRQLDNWFNSGSAKDQHEKQLAFLDDMYRLLAIQTFLNVEGDRPLYCDDTYNKPVKTFHISGGCDALCIQSWTSEAHPWRITTAFACNDFSCCIKENYVCRDRATGKITTRTVFSENDLMAQSDCADLGRPDFVKRFCVGAETNRVEPCEVNCDDRLWNKWCKAVEAEYPLRYVYDNVALAKGNLSERYETEMFDIHPNPTSDFLTVSFSEGNFSKLTISDNSGRVYTELAIAAKDTEMKIDVSKLTTGVYYIMVTDNNNIIRFKQFIKE